MSRSISHHYPIRRLHILCVVFGTCLLGLLGWALCRENTRDWQKIQRKALNIRRSVAMGIHQGADSHTLWTLRSSARSEPGALDGPRGNPLSSRPNLCEVVLSELPLLCGAVPCERRDRCITCHGFVDWALADLRGQPARSVPRMSQRAAFPWQQITERPDVLQPALLRAQKLEIVLPFPQEVPARLEANEAEQLREKGAETPHRTRSSEQLGIYWCFPGWEKEDEPRVGAIRKGSPAEAAGLQPGDLVLSIGPSSVSSVEDCETLFSQVWKAVESGGGWDELGIRDTWFPANFGAGARPVPGVLLRIERGVSQPFASHPRLDLFVHPQSVHPVHRYGCTICHDGQGRATDLAGAEHFQTFPEREGPLHPPAATSLAPMPPQLFVQSRCLRCHGRVFDLGESDQPWGVPAGMLLEGRRLVERFGCYACHRFTRPGTTEWTAGYDLQPTGPGLEVAEEVLSIQPPPEVASAAQRLLDQSYSQENAGELLQALRDWQATLHSVKAAEEERQRTLKLSQLITALESQKRHVGTVPKPGPSLRFVAAKLSRETVRQVITNPQLARPASRMPRFFGIAPARSGSSSALSGLEAAEIEGIIEYLFSRSQPLPECEPVRAAVKSDYAPDDGDSSESIQTGRILFETQGCLACHSHRDFPESRGNVGPDLSDLATRFQGSQAAQWLRRWLDNPRSLSPGTRMPRPQFRDDSWLYRVFVKHPDQTPNVTPSAGEGGQTKQQSSSGPLTRTDAIEAITAYLLGGAPSKSPPPANNLPDSALNAALREYLSQEVGPGKAERYAAGGVPAEEFVHFGPPVVEALFELAAPLSREKKLRYLGRKAIARYGCYACHSISGFEGQPTTGPDLSTWASKATMLLDFAHLVDFLVQTPEGQAIQAEMRKDPDLRPLLSQRRRETWLWFKLREPRVFDYQMTLQSPLHGLRMGRVPLTKEQCLAVMTFVLGLDGFVPPPEYSPYRDEARAIRATGRALLERHGCDRCHLLRPETWIFRYLAADPPHMPGGGTLSADPPWPKDEAVETSKSARASPAAPLFEIAAVTGRAQRDAEGHLLEDLDDYDNPLYFFEPWQPVQLGATIWPVGQAAIPIARPQILFQSPQQGGEWAEQLYPRLVTFAQELGYSTGTVELWGAVPPPLCYKGASVRESWLRGFLRQPSPIRPAVPLAMPAYLLADWEIEALVAYFRVHASGPIPSEKSFRQIEEILQKREEAFPGRLEAAERLIHDTKTFCAKCHTTGGERLGGLTSPNEAPPLHEVYRRLQGEYISQWIENPRAILPYTAMPVNFPPDGEPLDRSVFDAPSDVQREAVVDLLRYYDWYLWKKRLPSPEPPSEHGR